MFGRYLQFLDVVPEDSLLYVAHHNPVLVGLPIVIAVFAAFTSLLVARYAERTDDGRDEAMTMVGDREKAIEAGMDDHIAKPLDVDAMFVTLAKWIKPAASVTVQDTPVALPTATPRRWMSWPIWSDLRPVRRWLSRWRQLPRSSRITTSTARWIPWMARWCRRHER